MAVRVAGKLTVTVQYGTHGCQPRWSDQLCGAHSGSPQLYILCTNYTHVHIHMHVHIHLYIIRTHVHTQVYTLKSLQSCTELGHSELCDALLALTADRQSLLHSSATSPPHHDATSPLPEDDGYFPNTPFKPSTSFWVNERFAEEIARRHESNHFRFHDVRLVGKSLGQPGQSREERSIDLAHVFERRRAIIDSAIVRVLKKEKTLSVDTMAVKVCVCIHVCTVIYSICACTHACVYSDI